MLSYAQRLILLEDEGASYGVDPVLIAADAKLVRNLRITPIGGTWGARDQATGVAGAQPERLTGAHGLIEFDVEAGGGGAAGTAPIWGDIMLACGFAETVTVDTSVEYSLVSDGHGSCAVGAHIGGAEGHNQKLLGCRGNVGFTAAPGNEPLFNVRLQGRYAGPVKAAPTAGDFTAHVKAPAIEPPNVPVFTLGGDDLCLASLSITGGPPIRVARYANCDDVTLGADHAYTGRATVRMPAIDAKDLIAEAYAGTRQALAYQHGTVAGNIVSLAAPKVQIKNPQYQNADGDVELTLDLVFTADAGDDELVWTVT